MEYSEFGEYERVSDEQAADDARWLASLPAGKRALVEMMIARMCEAEADSTHRPRG
ncbi:hypothetical protein [Nocardiopsis flavescens]